MSGRQDTGVRRTQGQADPAAPTTAPLLPTQTGHAVSAPVPVVPSRPAPGDVVPAPAPPTHSSAVPAVLEPAPDAPTPHGTAGRRRSRQVAALVTAGAVLVAAGGTWAVQQERAERADARRAAQARVDGIHAAVAPELTAGRLDGAVAGAAVAAALRTDATSAGRAAVDHATATLAGSAQAGDGPRGALQAAITGASGALTAPAVSLTTLRTVPATLAAPEKAVVDAQAAWQAAETARLAAEAAAAQAAAEAAAARMSTRRTSSGTTTRRTTTATTTGGGSDAGAPEPAVAGLPTAGSEASAGEVGAALNAHRAANGLGALSIVRSGARVEHAMQMAASDSIWHSGTREGSPKARPEIVGRVSPGSATRMIAAYAASSGHNEQMLGSYSTAYIGAVSSDGWLYTSITFS